MKPYIENIFISSCNSDELFDALNLAIRNNFRDIDLYKALLANPALSKDELMMFGEKISKEFTEHSYDVFMWLAGIFEQQYDDYDCVEKALYYYQKAFFTNQTAHEPLLSAIKLYNYDLHLDSNQTVMRFVNNGVEKVERKSFVYHSLADHHEKMGNDELAYKLRALAERTARKEKE
ncbi:MAG: hypothetical protein V1720_20840 [bacterium]